MEPSLPLPQSIVKAAFAARQARLKNAEALEAGVVEERANQVEPDRNECENEYCWCHTTKGYGHRAEEKKA